MSENTGTVLPGRHGRQAEATTGGRHGRMKASPKPILDDGRQALGRTNGDANQGIDSRGAPWFALGGYRYASVASRPKGDVRSPPWFALGGLRVGQRKTTLRSPWFAAYASVCETVYNVPDLWWVNEGRH